MSLRPLALPQRPGSLWLASMPGRFEPWPEFLAEAARRRIALLLCLTPRDELAELSPSYDAAIAAGRLPFRWQCLPMRNFGLPLEPEAFRAGIELAADRLAAGDAVVLHCAAGIGRTGTAAACLLKQLGWPVEEAVRAVRAAGSNPENALQSGLVDWF